MLARSATIIVLLVFLGAQSMAREMDQNRLASAAQVPLGFKLFCLKNPAHCAPAHQQVVALSENVMKSLRRINVGLNRTISARADASGTDIWSIATNAGDCEDYVLAKRAALIGAGFPAGALRVATARMPNGEGHAVLIVKTNAGDLVLDNRTNTIVPKSSVDLQFVAISGANPLLWTNDG